MKKIVSLVISILLVIVLTSVAFAEEEVTQPEEETTLEEINVEPKLEVVFASEEEPEKVDVIKRAAGVTEEMSHADFWKSHALGDANDIIMTAKDIAAKNSLFLDNSAKTYMYDLEKFTDDLVIDNNASKEKLIRAIEEEIEVEDYVAINGKAVTSEDIARYKRALQGAILFTGYTNNHNYQYAVGVRRTNIGCAPTTDYFGNSLLDLDNELYSASLDVNEPFVIEQKCTFNGNVFYWGYSNNCTGWILAEDVAVCEDVNEWLDAWKVDLTGKDFIVVTQDKIVLEPSKDLAYSSELKLTMGTVLKLVPENIEKEIGERGEWNNYIVYLPTRKADGSYEKKMALISEHHSVSVGFLPMTQGNILDVAFSCLGNRLGWANDWDSFDCGGYTRAIYKCFGLEIPRNSTQQAAVSATTIDITNWEDPEKEQLFRTIPIGSLLYFPGNIAMYLGSEDGKDYVICDVYSLAETDTQSVHEELNVVVNPLTVRRGRSTGFKTWLSSMTKVVILPNFISLDDCDIEVFHDRSEETFAVTPYYKGRMLSETINYETEFDTDLETNITTMKITGINNCLGTRYVVLDPASPCSKHTVVEDKGFAATCTSPGLTDGSHCSVCGEVIVKQEIISALGHEWEDKYTVDKMFSETEEGLMSIHCKHCGAVKNQIPIPKITKEIKPNPSDPVDTGDTKGKQFALFLLILICAGGVIFIVLSTGVVMTNGKKIYLKAIEKLRRK